MNDLKLIADGLHRFMMKKERPMQRKRDIASTIISIRPDRKELVRFLYVFLKYLIFNAATVLSALVAIYVFTVPIEDYKSFGKLSVPILLLMANIVFVLYDLLLKRYKPLLDALMPKIEKYLR